MTQRKLTQEELQHVEKASWYLQSVIKQCGLIRGGGVVLVDYLTEIAAHGTTDGKPWIEPQPEIGDGYRLATKADNDRLDLEVVIDNRWVKTGPGVLDGFNYRVPVDRIPTDEDAVGRPTVMMAKDGICFKAMLLAVCPGSYWQFCGLSEGAVVLERECRFPYPGELD